MTDTIKYEKLLSVKWKVKFLLTWIDGGNFSEFDEGRSLLFLLRSQVHVDLENVAVRYLETILN